MDAPDPTVVGNAFIVQYYTILNKNPESLHNFYNERSECTYGFEDEGGKTAKGLEGVEKVIASTGYENCKVALTSVDCQGSVNGGILVSVIGKLRNNDGPPQKFIQSFFLERLENSFFVLNDVFRFLRDDDAEDDVNEDGEEEAEEEEVPLQVERTPTPTTTPPVAPQQLVTEPADSPKSEPILHAVASASATASVSIPTPAVPHPPTTSSANAGTPPPEREKKVAPETKGAEAADSRGSIPRNWASIAASQPEGVKVESERPAPSRPPAKLRVPAAIHKDRPAVQLPQRSRPTSLSPVLAEGCSIYASGLPFDVTHEQLSALFSTHGKVRNIVLKAVKGYAFIEYESPQAVAAALESITNSPPVLGSRKLIIEERKPRSGNSARSSSPRSRGRGGASRGPRGSGGSPSFGYGVAPGAGNPPAGKEYSTEKRRTGFTSGSPRNDPRRGSGDQQSSRRSGESRSGKSLPRNANYHSAVNNGTNNNNSTNNNTNYNNPDNNTNAGGVPKGGGPQPKK